MQSSFMWTVKTDKTAQMCRELSFHWVDMSDGTFSHVVAHYGMKFMQQCLPLPC